MNKKLISLLLTFCMLFSCAIPVFAWDAATNEVDLRVGLFSDSHNNTTVIQNVLDAFNAVDPNLDGVVMAGDIVYMSGNTVDTAAYDGLMAMTSVTDLISDNKLVYAMGNHEMPLHGDATLGETSRALFTEKTGLATETVTNIGGYTFIAAGASNYAGDYTAQEAWMKTQLETALSDNTQKPVFLIIHHPVQGSTYGANAVGYSAEFKAYIESQPRIVVVSGHVHQPLHDPKTIKQIENGCTYIQTAHTGNGNAVDDSFATLSLPNTAENMDSSAVMMEIKDNVVTLNRMDIKSGEYFGEPWVIDIPKMIAGNASAYKYTDARYEESEAPVFKAGSAAVSDVTESAATFTFPAATKLTESELDFAEYYRIKIIDGDVMLVKSNNVMISDYFKATQADTVTQTISGLKAGTNYRAEISAISPYFVESAPMTVSFTTAEPPVDYGVELTKNATEHSAGSEGGTDYPPTWATGGSGWRTYTFDITEPGIYKVSTSLASEGCTAAVSITQNETTETFAEQSVNTGGFGVYADYDWGSYALQAGTATVMVQRTGAGADPALRINTITLTKVGEITPGDIGYTVTQNLNDKTAYQGLGSATGSAGFSGSGYVTWKLVPEYSGKYKISIKTGCTVSAPVSVYNAENAGISDDNLIGSQDVEIAGSSYGKTQYFDFGELSMLAGQEYYITMKYTKPSGATSTPYTSNSGAIMATWLEDVDIADVGYSIEKTTSVADDCAHGGGSGLATYFGFSGSGHYAEWNFTPEYSGEYDISVRYGTLNATTEVTVDGVSLGTKFVENTTAGATWTSNAEYRSFGTVTMLAGQTYKVRYKYVSGTDSVYLARIKATWLEEADPESTFIKEATFDHPTTRTDHNISSVNIGTSYAVVEDSDAYVEHTVTMSEGNYDLFINYGCQSKDGVIGVYVNGEYYGKFDAPINNAWNTNQTTLKLTTVRLEEGENIIKFTAPGGKYYCYTTFNFKAIETPSVLLYKGEAAEIGNEVTEVTDGDMTVRALLPRDVKDQKVRMIFAIYKNETELYKVETLEVTAGAATAIAVPMEDIVLEDSAEYTYKAFFWDGFENITPLY